MEMPVKLSAAGQHRDDADPNGRSGITHPGRRSRFFL
jgi:hypothetical protein